MKRFVLVAAAVGVVLPILIFVVSEAMLVTGIWWFNTIPFVWPTYIMVLPFSGSFDGSTVGILLLAAAANSVIYAVIGAVLYLLVGQQKK